MIFICAGHTIRSGGHTRVSVRCRVVSARSVSMWCMVYVTWYMVHGVWYMVHGRGSGGRSWSCWIVQILRSRFGSHLSDTGSRLIDTGAVYAHLICVGHTVRTRQKCWTHASECALWSRVHVKRQLKIKRSSSCRIVRILLALASRARNPDHSKSESKT